MSGHSKWNTIKHKKAKTDAKRGKAFTRLIKEITVAARAGGGDPEMNPRLRTAVAAAKAANMPQDNVTRAIKKGTGELEGASYEESTYEGYGPGGVAVLIEIITDNKNRSVAEIRHIFSKNNGNLGESGCVAWMFEKRGLISLDKGGTDEDKLLEVAIESGADDVVTEDTTFSVYVSPDEFNAVKEAIEGAGFKPVFAELTMIPQSTVKLAGKEALQMLRLMDAFEEHDDIQNSYANFDISEEEMEALSAT